MPSTADPPATALEAQQHLMEQEPQARDAPGADDSVGRLDNARGPSHPGGVRRPPARHSPPKWQCWVAWAFRKSKASSRAGAEERQLLCQGPPGSRQKDGPNAELRVGPAVPSLQRPLHDKVHGKIRWIRAAEEYSPDSMAGLCRPGPGDERPARRMLGCPGFALRLPRTVRPRQWKHGCGLSIVSARGATGIDHEQPQPDVRGREEQSFCPSCGPEMGDDLVGVPSGIGPDNPEAERCGLRPAAGGKRQRQRRRGRLEEEESKGKVDKEDGVRACLQIALDLLVPPPGLPGNADPVPLTPKSLDPPKPVYGQLGPASASTLSVAAVAKPVLPEPRVVGRPDPLSGLSRVYPDQSSPLPFLPQPLHASCVRASCAPALHKFPEASSVGRPSSASDSFSPGPPSKPALASPGESSAHKCGPTRLAKKQVPAQCLKAPMRKPSLPVSPSLKPMPAPSACPARASAPDVLIGYDEEVTFCSMLAGLPRAVVASRTKFSKFLCSTFHLQKAPAPPLPYFFRFLCHSLASSKEVA